MTYLFFKLFDEKVQGKPGEAMAHQLKQLNGLGLLFV